MWWLRTRSPPGLARSLATRRRRVGRHCADVFPCAASRKRATRISGVLAQRATGPAAVGKHFRGRVSSGWANGEHGRCQSGSEPAGAGASSGDAGEHIEKRGSPFRNVACEAACAVCVGPFSPWCLFLCSCSCTVSVPASKSSPV